MTTRFLYILPLFITLQIHSGETFPIELIWHMLSEHYQEYGNISLAHEYRDMALQAGNDEALAYYGVECAKNGAIEKARECFNKLPFDDQSMAHLLLALVDNDPEQAMEYARMKHRQKDDDDYIDNWMCTLGMLYTVMERYSYAERCYQEALIWGVGDDLYTHVGSFYKYTGDLDRAVQYYTIARERKEESYNGLELGKLYYTQGGFDLARACIEEEKYLGLEEKGYLALIYKAQGNDSAYKFYLSKVDANLAQTISTDELLHFIKEEKRLGTEAFWLELLANAYMRRKQYTEALPRLLRLVEIGQLQGVPLNELNKRTLLMLAKTYYRLGNVDQAEKIYKIHEHSADPKILEDVLYGLGRIAEYKKKYAKAEDYYKWYLVKEGLPRYKKRKVLSLLINICKKRGKTTLASSYEYQLQEERTAERQWWVEHGFESSPKVTVKWL